jgi:hypothetical protein
MKDAKKIIELQQQKVVAWHEKEYADDQEGFLKIVCDNHWMNFQLWHEEDKARRDDMGFEYIYHAKRHIDRFNQARNNFVEAMDKSIYENLSPKEHTPINSETPGMMIDR